MTTKEELQQKGGSWLGAARSWIKWNVVRGDSVQWGSDDPVLGLTVRKLEDLAAEVAAAALNDVPERSS
jgi:hypothetical protein